MAKSKEIIEIGLLGLGTVGQGVVELLERNRPLIESRIGAPVRGVVALVRDMNKPRPDLPAGIELTDDPARVLENPRVKMVVELMGGFEPARGYILRAIHAGKHVVTANKAVMSRHWDEIFQAAHDRQVDVYLEAAVGGGIPCIQAINDGLAANRIENLLAILNGTTNYILTKMAEDGKSFKEALAEAQKKGYAEADPSYDLDGHDAAQKLAILASIAFDQRICVEDIQVQGIREISLRDIADAREELGCEIKLLAVAKAHGDDGLELRVAPTLIPKDHPLASVDDVYNAIFVNGDAVGNVMLYGRGAGKLPTASAVISDIIFIGRNLAAGVAGKVPSVAYDVNRVASRRVLRADEVQGRYFLRFVALDQPGVLATISGILAEFGISISSVAQKERKKGDKVPVIISTYNASEKSLMDALAAIERLPVIKDKTLVMRLEIPEED